MLNQIKKSGNEYYYHGRKHFIADIACTYRVSKDLCPTSVKFDFIEYANVPKFSNRPVLHIEQDRK